MSDKDYIQQLLSDPTMKPEKSWVLSMQSKYPTFVTPSLLLLKRTELSEQEQKELMQFVILRSSNRRMLSIELNRDIEAVSSLLAPMSTMREKYATTENSTEATIDTFLSNYGSNSQNELNAIENAIFNPTADYILTLDDNAEETNQEDTSSIPLLDENEFRNSIQSSINAATPATSDEQMTSCLEETTPITITESMQEKTFIDSDTTIPKSKEQKLDKKPVSEEDSDTVQPVKARTTKSLTESLAMAYIKQKKYAQAYDMLCAIRHNAPGVNPNIEDQIRYLSLLIKYNQ